MPCTTTVRSRSWPASASASPACWPSASRAWCLLRARRTSRRPSRPSRPADPERDAAGKRLVDDAVALGGLEQRVELLVARVGLELEAQADRGEADRRLAVDAHRAAEVEVAFGHHATAHLEAAVDGDRAQRHARTSDQGLQEHVARARERAVPAGRRVQAGLDERAAGLDRARDFLGAELAVGPQRHARARGVLAVALLQRPLGLAELLALHETTAATCLR